MAVVHEANAWVDGYARSNISIVNGNCGVTHSLLTVENVVELNGTAQYVQA